MKILSKATSAKPPRTTESRSAAYLYALILIVFALGQLFTFDEFTALIGTFYNFGGMLVPRIIASLFVVSEVFALPFLLGMRLSNVIRYASMALSWFVPVGWLAITLWLNIANVQTKNVGFLGTKVELVLGWWTVSFVLSLAILAIWSSWGLWPGKRKN